MISKIKKPVSILLSLIMVFSVFTIVPITASAAVGDFVPESEYLTFTAEEANSSVTLRFRSCDYLQYNKNNSGWEDYSNGMTITLNNVGDSVRFCGTGTTFNSSNHVTLTGKVACSGNVMSLRLDDYGEVQGLSTNCFSNMFKDCTGLTAAPELPETILADYCYERMFYGCANLTVAPELPATMLATGCYSAMFAGCERLTTAPELWATSLTPYCYSNMFSGCASLTTAPELPATALAPNCYGYMFEGCTNLTTAPELWATTLEYGCYSYMFSGCERLTTAPELPATTLARYCYRNMFYGCERLTELPALPATTLENGCYGSMFTGCSSIKLSETQTAEYSIPYSVPSGGNGTTASSALDYMFAGTGGTFTGTPEINKTYYLYREVPKYTVTWNNWDDTELDTDEVEEGATPSYTGETPTKDADENNTYTFAGWSPAIAPVTEDVTYTAQFDATPKTPAAGATYVKVTSEPDDWSGDYLIVYEDGSTAFNGSADELNSSGNYIDVTISNGEIESNAATDAAKVTIAQIDGGYSIATATGAYIGGVSGQNKLDFRDEAILNTISLEDDSAQIVSNTSTLRFNSSWSGFRYYKTVSQKPVQLYKLTGGSAPVEPPTVDGQVTWTQADMQGSGNGDFTKDGVTLTVDDNEPHVQDCIYDDGVNTFTAPGKTFSKIEIHCSYCSATPSGWTMEGEYGSGYTLTWTGNAESVTIQAFATNIESIVFTFAEPAPAPTYTVTWKNEDGTILETDTDVAEGTTPTYDGATPTKTSDNYYTYTFAGWNDGETTYAPNELPAVSGDVTYTAQYTATAKTFVVFAKTITEKTIFVYDVSGETTVAQVKEMLIEGSGIPAAQQRLIFAGAEMEDTKTLADYNIQKESTIHVVAKEYTVTWLNYDNSELGTTTVQYGTTPTYDGATPYKADGADCIYTFSGWTPEVTAVTGDATYTATFTETEKPETIKDCTNKFGDFRLYANVPLVQYSDFNDILDGAVMVLTYGDSNTMIPVLDAKGYTYKFYDQTGTEIPAQIADSSSEPGSDYGFSDDVTVYTNVINFTRPAGCTAIYIVATAPEPITYTVTWMNGDDILETDTDLEPGALPSYDGETPTKDEDDDFTYEFIGWTCGPNFYYPDELPIVDGDTTYYAEFSSTPKHEAGYYVVGTMTNWKIDDNYLLTKNTEAEGDEFVLSGVAFTSTDAIKVVKYEAGQDWTWYPSGTGNDYAITADGTYDIYFRPNSDGGDDWYEHVILAVNVTEYTITWKNDDGSVIDTTTVVYGDTPTHADATKAPDKYYTYTFAGWTPELAAVTGDAEYTAQFTPVAKTFMVFVKRPTGSTINVYDLTGETTVAQLKAIIAEKENIPVTEQKLIFAGTQLEDEKTLAEYNIEKESTLHLVLNTYTVTWLDEDGSLLETDENVPYGTMPAFNGEIPAKGEEATTFYTFAGWSPEVDAVTGDITYTATYTSALKNGPWSDGYFYLDGVIQRNYQMIKWQGDYYFINDYHKYARNTRLYLTQTWLAEYGFADGYYDFDDSGKMIIKNGPLEDGYFYVNGARLEAYQLAEWEGDYYFISDSHKYAKNKRIYLSAQYVEGTDLTVGYYWFDADGKMTVLNGFNDDGYFYINGIRQKNYQLIEFEGDYYFINDYNKAARNERLYLSDRFLTGTDLKPGYYDFGDDGKMILKNGPMEDGYFYINGARQMAYQIVKYEGKYYFISDCHKYAKNQRLYIGAKFVEGTDLAAGYYDFGEDGAIENPVVIMIG